jgi:hypothetical protein
MFLTSYLLLVRSSLAWLWLPQSLGRLPLGPGPAWGRSTVISCRIKNSDWTDPFCLCGGPKIKVVPKLGGPPQKPGSEDSVSLVLTVPQKSRVITEKETQNLSPSINWVDKSHISEKVMVRVILGQCSPHISIVSRQGAHLLVFLFCFFFFWY